MVFVLSRLNPLHKINQTSERVSHQLRISNTEEMVEKNFFLGEILGVYILMKHFIGISSQTSH